MSFLVNQADVVGITPFVSSTSSAPVPFPPSASLCDASSAGRISPPSSPPLPPRPPPPPARMHSVIIRNARKSRPATKKVPVVRPPSPFPVSGSSFSTSAPPPLTRHPNSAPTPSLSAPKMPRALTAAHRPESSTLRSTQSVQTHPISLAPSPLPSSSFQPLSSFRCLFLCA